MRIKLKNIEVLNCETNKYLNSSSYLTTPLLERDKINISFNPVTKEIIGSKNILENPENRISCLYYDDEAIYEFNDYLYLSLACQDCSQSFYNKSKLKVNNVLIDKFNHMLYVLKDDKQLHNYIRGENFEYLFSKRLNSFTNVTFPTIKQGPNETYRNVNQGYGDDVYNEEKGKYEKESPLNLYQVKLIENHQQDIISLNNKCPLNNTIKKISNSIPIFSIYKFSSAHTTKINLFKKIIEEITGFTIVYR